jgi:AcrR family transcriptional regulator
VTSRKAETARAPVTRRLRAPARRARIAEAALEAFASRGYDAISVGEIAIAAGVTRTVLYDHFPSKKALFLWLLERESSQLLDHVAARILAEGPRAERMRRAIDAFLSFVETHPLAWRLLSREGAGDEEIAATQDRLRARNTEALRRLLAADLRAAGIEPGSERAEILVELAASAVEGIARWAHDHPDVPREELVEVAMELHWGGLARLVGEQPAAGS